MRLRIRNLWKKRKKNNLTFSSSTTIPNIQLKWTVWILKAIKIVVCRCCSYFIFFLLCTHSFTYSHRLEWLQFHIFVIENVSKKKIINEMKRSFRHDNAYTLIDLTVPINSNEQKRNYHWQISTIHQQFIYLNFFLVNIQSDMNNGDNYARFITKS